MVEKYLGNNEIREALIHYDLGELVTINRIRRADENMVPVYILKTTQGEFFVKQYWRFDESIMHSLILTDYLGEKDLPIIKVFTTFEGKPFFKINNKAIAIFEIVNPEQSLEFTANQPSELGKYLGKLHSLTLDYEGKRSGLNLDYYLSVIENNQDEIAESGAESQQIFEFVHTNLLVLKDKSHELPKSICHNNFTAETTRLIDGKLVKIMDWEFSRDFMVLDLGSIISAAVDDNELRLDYFEAVLKNYSMERNLEEVEIAVLFEALVYGTAKPTLTELIRGSINSENLKRLEVLKKLGKVEIDTKISSMI